VALVAAGLQTRGWIRLDLRFAARSLGLAIGSVGVIRRRCLKKLESAFGRLGLSS
jgi:hypothetical protein